MTDAELSLKIAAFLEPKPQREPDKIFPVFGKCWYPDPRVGVVPRDMVNDPAMRDMLLQKLLEADFHFTYWPRPGGGAVAHFANASGFFFKLDTTFERMPAEAFAKAKGLL